MNPELRKRVERIVSTQAKAASKKWSGIGHDEFLQQAWLVALESYPRTDPDQGVSTCASYIRSAVYRGLLNYATRTSLIAKYPRNREYEYLGKSISVPLDTCDNQPVAYTGPGSRGRCNGVGAALRGYSPKQPRAVYFPEELKALVAAGDELVLKLPRLRGKAHIRAQEMLDKVCNRISDYCPY